MVSTTLHLSQADFITLMLKESEGMVRRLAYKYHADFEDLQQEAALIVLQAREQAPQNHTNLTAWFVLHIKYGLLKLLARSVAHPTLSLDMPLSDDSEMTFADLLPAPESMTCDEQREDERTAAVHAALRCMPLECQQFVRERYGLNDYQPVPLWPPRKNHTQRSEKSVRDGAFYHLRKNKALAAAVGVQA